MAREIGRGPVMAARFSILFGRMRPPDVDRTAEPSYFGDLRLDQVVAEVVGQGDLYGLAPLFHALVADHELLRLRQDVFDDIAKTPVRDALDRFSQQMGVVHDRIRASNHLRVPAQRDRWHLNAAAAYCTAVHDLSDALGEDGCGAASVGLDEIGGFLRTLVDSAAFQTLDREQAPLEDRLRDLQYAVVLKGAKVTVGGYDGEADYGKQVVELFARFRQDQHAVEAKEAEFVRRRRIQESGGDPVRERIIGLVAELHPDLFAELHTFRQRHPEFLDPTVSLFYRELQFYLRYADLVAGLRRDGLPFTRPRLQDSAGVLAEDTFDFALALRQHFGRHGEDRTPIVRNDLRLEPDERRLVVTGPNQGGKTTFSRTIGQLHHLAALGCPVPGRTVELQPPDRIFSHFEREELGHDTGKLEDDLLRLHAILDQATETSLVILNEIFASTTTADAIELATGVLDRISESGALCVCVTFLDELTRLPDTVTMVAQVDPEDPTRRTFRVVRAVADGRAYATALAVKHGLTYEDVRGRVG